MNTWVIEISGNKHLMLVSANEGKGKRKKNMKNREVKLEI